eukprot:1594688-Prymnesium_polylepis.1
MLAAADCAAAPKARRLTVQARRRAAHQRRPAASRARGVAAAPPCAAAGSPRGSDQAGTAHCTAADAAQRLAARRARPR